MPRIAGGTEVDDRIAELLAIYGAADACAADLLCDRWHPDRLAYRLVRSDLTYEEISYGELRRDSERFAAALSDLGVRPGDRIATLMGKSRQYLVTMLATWRLGAVHVPLFTAFAPAAIALRLAGSRTRIVVCDAVQRPKLMPGEHIAVDHPWRVVTTGACCDGDLGFDALVDGAHSGFPAVALGGDAPIIHIYTSGTTGNPKGVIVPMRALASFLAYAEFGLGIRPEEDVYWCAADPGWAYGLYYGILTSFQTGVKSIWVEGGFSPELTMAVLERHEVSNFAAAPTVYRALRSSGVRAGKLSLRRASSAGEPLTPEVNEWARTALGTEIHDHYGQTETGMLINNHHHPAVRRPIKTGSMGRSMPGWKAAILDERRDEEIGPGRIGRVAMVLPESPLAWFEGYDGDPARSSEKLAGDGRWYVTGDTGHVDDDGDYYFSARDDDVIIMAGYRIGPFEVEAVMATHPAVAECAVISVPDQIRGEVIEAFVVTREGYAPDADLEDAIRRWVKSNYAAHAFPRRVHFAQTLPKTPSGKVQRFVLKRQRLDELSRQQGNRS